MATWEAAQWRGTGSLAEQRSLIRRELALLPARVLPLSTQGCTNRSVTVTMSCTGIPTRGLWRIGVHDAETQGRAYKLSCLPHAPVLHELSIRRLKSDSTSGGSQPRTAALGYQMKGTCSGRHDEATSKPV